MMSPSTRSPTPDRLRLHSYGPSAYQGGDQKDNKQHEKYEEQYLGNPGGRSGDTREPEGGGDQRNDQENQRPSEQTHGHVLSGK
jgi:hypothetical protein